MNSISCLVSCEMPVDLKLTILSHLSPGELFDSRLVSKEWKILSENDILWKSLYEAFHFCSSKNLDYHRNTLLTDLLKHQEKTNKIISYLDTDNKLAAICPFIKFDKLIKMHPFDRPFFIISEIRKSDKDILTNKIADAMIEQISIENLEFEREKKYQSEKKYNLISSIREFFPDQTLTVSQMFSMQKIMNAFCIRSEIAIPSNPVKIANDTINNWARTGRY
ncbi:MAG: F-box protein [Candidatus Protochlamydia sp.]|nr:F-box protein [Candidatus Protochlamydia sp.]